MFKFYVIIHYIFLATILYIELIIKSKWLIKKHKIRIKRSLKLINIIRLKQTLAI